MNLCLKKEKLSNCRLLSIEFIVTIQRSHLKYLNAKSKQINYRIGGFCLVPAIHLLNCYKNDYKLFFRHPSYVS